MRGDSEGVRFKFHLRGGDHVELHIRERRFFCEKNKDGRSTWLAFSDIARIVMLAENQRRVGIAHVPTAVGYLYLADDDS